MRRWMLSGLLLLPALSFCIAVEIHCRTRTVVAVKKKWIEQHASGITTLVLGDSQAQTAVNPSLIGDSCGSLALSGQPLVMDYLLLQRYAPYMPHLRTVLLEVSPHRLYHDIERDAWNAHLYQVIYSFRRTSFADYSFLAASPRHSASLFTSYYRAGVFRPVVDERGYIINDSVGHFNILHYDTASISRNIPVVRLFAGKAMSDSAVCYLEKIAAFCSTRKINLVFFTTPVYTTFARQVPGSAKARASEVLEGITQHYHIPYLRHTDDSIYNVWHYRDHNHLNPRGGAVFTAALRRQLTSINL
ncbi:MAG: hypothetical protein KF744_05760 [Taibaiella sp.]|nr:hypothetical protein [Taibaiella sp.]